MFQKISKCEACANTGNTGTVLETPRNTPEHGTSRNTQNNKDRQKKRIIKNTIKNILGLALVFDDQNIITDCHLGSASQHGEWGVNHH